VGLGVYRRDEPGFRDHPRVMTTGAPEMHVRRTAVGGLDRLLGPARVTDRRRQAIWRPLTRRYEFPPIQAELFFHHPQVVIQHGYAGQANGAARAVRKTPDESIVALGSAMLGSNVDDVSLAAIPPDALVEHTPSPRDVVSPPISE
jgi:hypothetical protein